LAVVQRKNAVETVRSVSISIIIQTFTSGGTASRQLYRYVEDVSQNYLANSGLMFSFSNTRKEQKKFKGLGQKIPAPCTLAQEGFSFR